MSRFIEEGNRSQGTLLPESTVAIDGGKFKAVNHRDRNFTSGKMKTRMALIEESIAEYLNHLDRTDRNASAWQYSTSSHLS